MNSFSLSDLVLAFFLGIIVTVILVATSEKIVAVDGNKLLTVEYKGENYRLQPLEDQ